MKLGAIFPTTEIGSDPAAIRDWAQAAEELGFASIVAYEHVLGSIHAGREPALMGPYTERDAFHEPMVLFGYLAAVTREIELSTGVLILPQRQTALAAKQAAEVDLLSGGRLRLTVGSGWNHVEYEALGQSWETRGARLTEQVELMRRLWREPVVDFRGKFDRIDRSGMLPQPGRIPIWFGGYSEPAMRRAARIGDGFMFGGSPSQQQALIERQKELVVAEGRDLADFGLEATVDFSAGPDTWRKELELWQQMDGDLLTLRAMDTASAALGIPVVGYKGTRDYIDALEKFRDATR